MSSEENRSNGNPDPSKAERAKAAVAGFQEQAKEVGETVAERVRDRLEDTPFVDSSPTAKAKRTVKKRSSQAVSAAKQRPKSLVLLAVVVAVIALLIVARSRNGATAPIEEELT
jgi:cobalamin biosynthesis Mg chelatase CobN